MSEAAIIVKDVSKKYRLFDSARDRLKEALHPFSKHYHREFWALKGVSFEVPRGQTLGILGRNGSGKSTLLQIIAGIMQPTTGEVIVNGRVSALLELGAGFNPEFTGRENVLFQAQVMGLSRDEINRRLPEIEAFADVGEFFDQPVKTYSSGMFVRVAFAAATSVDPDILIVDEALSVGDIAFQEKCFHRFASFREAGGTVLFVSHATSLVEQLCDVALVLEGGCIKFTGDPQAAVDYFEAILFPRRYQVAIAENIDSPPQSDKAFVQVVTPEEVREGREAQMVNVSHHCLGPLLQAMFAENSVGDCAPLRRNYNKEEIRFGDGGGEIVDYLVVAEGEEDPVTICSGAWVDVYLKVIGRTGIEQPSIGVGIFTVQGLMVAAGNARLLRVKLSPILPGKHYIYRMSFNTPLSEGHYFLHFGLTEATPEGIRRHDARRSVVMLRVEATPWLEGLVDFGMRLVELRSRE